MGDDDTVSNSPHRSHERIQPSDLRRLAKLAQADLNDLFSRISSGIYFGRCILMCLSQGAAQHFVHNDRGVQDFDVWAFSGSTRQENFHTAGAERSILALRDSGEILTMDKNSMVAALMLWRDPSA